MHSKSNDARLWFILVTGRCNLRCRYCGGSFPEKYVPHGLRFDISILKNIIRPCDNVCFYGGEPLLNVDDILRIVNTLKVKKFIIQTNATLVENVPAELWKKIDVVLLSIDGIEEITDKNRGRGVYRKVINAARYLRKIGFKGELIARMTVTEDSDIYRDVTHLLKLGLFDKIHWQLNVVWCDYWDFEKWAWKSYVPGFYRLVKLFLEYAEHGVVLKIVPITGMLTAILYKPNVGVPCGAGYRAFAINSDGRILACPIAVREMWATVGDVWRGITRTVTVGEPCVHCPYFRICGGRCLYAYIERTWGEDSFRDICRVTIACIEAVLRISDKIRKLVECGVVKKDEIFQDGIEDSTEIIP